MDDRFPARAMVDSSRGGMIAWVFDYLYDQVEWESSIWSARYPDADDIKHLYYPIYLQKFSVLCC